MKQVLLLMLLAAPAMGAFTFAGRRHSTAMRTTVPTRDTALFALATCDAAKENLVDVANRLQREEGTFVIDPEAKSELEQAVAELEAVANPPTQQDYDDYFSGDWTLICTTASTKSTIDSAIPKLPFLSSGPLADLRESLQNRVEVQQRIRSKDRIDHVLQFTPPDTLQDLFPSSSDIIPEALTAFNLNPLQVRKSKVTLIHKAEVESITPVLRTRLGLESIVLNIAGTSQVLDPSGADVLGLNLPLGDFLNANTFDTTYMDNEIRISRGKVGLLEQLRVFKRSSTMPDTEIMDEGLQEAVTDEDIVVVDEVVVAEEEAATVEEVEEKPSVVGVAMGDETVDEDTVVKDENVDTFVLQPDGAAVVVEEESVVEAVERAVEEALEKAVGELLEEGAENEESKDVEEEATDDNTDASSTPDEKDDKSYNEPTDEANAI